MLDFLFGVLLGIYISQKSQTEESSLLWRESYEPCFNICILIRVRGLLINIIDSENRLRIGEEKKGNGLEHIVNYSIKFDLKMQRKAPYYSLSNKKRKR